MIKRLLPLACALALLTHCASATDLTDTQAQVDSPSSTDAAAPPDGPLTPALVREKHQLMFDAVRENLNQPQLIIDGAWQLHYGDGGMFGPSFDLAQWKVTGDIFHFERAIDALDYNLALVEAATDDIAQAMDDIETVSMALLSLIEAGLYLEDATLYQEGADALLTPLDLFAIASSNYLDIDTGEFAATTYGPTALTAFLALVHFEHILAYPSIEPDKHLKRGTDILESAHKKAWDEAQQIYRFSPDDDRMFLYPNITMMLAYSRALEVSGDVLYRDRFEATYQGIQPLKDEDGDHYHSPYSAEEMGATDDDYATLSAENYLMLAWVAQYKNTGELKYLEEVDAILTFIEEKLLVEGQLLHHWVNGRPANEEDPWVYCLGCNFQTLYVMLLIESTLGDVPTPEARPGS